MSAPRKGVAPMKAHSLRESLAKTVRLLTKQGIDVSFRGHMPHVQAKGNKAVRLVLPELNDDADPLLIEAIQGFLDHEVGHIFYTPFARATKFFGKDSRRHSLLNIVEDIRLERKLPDDLPGTKENIERMHVKAIPFYFAPGTLEGAKHPDAGARFNAVLVCGLRALGGQKAFQQFMDDNNLWVHMKSLLVAMPDLSRRLRTMDSYDDVEAIVEDIIKATTPPPPPAPPPAPPQEPEKDDNPDQGNSSDHKGWDDEDEPEQDEPEGDSDPEDSDGGEGHGDGEGSDDGSDEEEGDSAGDDAGDEDSDEDGGSDPDDADGDSGEGDDADTGPHDHDAADPLNAGSGGKNNMTLTDALKQLEPNERRAIFLYKKRKQTVDQIASEMQISEDEVLDLLRKARKRLNELLSGDK